MSGSSADVDQIISQYQLNDASTGTAYLGVGVRNDGTDKYAFVQATYGSGSIPLRLGAASNDVLITGSNLGVGTLSPGYTLHVNGSVAGTSAYNNLSDRR